MSVSNNYSNKSKEELIQIIKELTEKETDSAITWDSKNQIAENLLNFKEAQQLSKSGNWELDVLQNKLYWSDEIYRIFGCNPQQFLATYEGFLSYIHPDDKSDVEIAFANHLKSNTEYSITHRIITENGEIKYVHERCKTEFDKHGKPIRSLGTVTDVTEQKVNEIKLKNLLIQNKQSENLLQSLISSIPDLIWLKDLNGLYLKCNKRFEDFFGATEEDIIGKSDYDFINSELADLFRANDIAAMNAGKAISNEEQITFANDGHSEYLETIKTPIYNDKKEVIGVLGIGRDITLRKIAEQSLIKAKEESEESEIMFRAISEQAMDSISLANTNGKYVFVNPAFCKMMGYSEQELTKMSVFDLKDPDDLSSTFNDTLDDNQATATRKRLICKDKTICVVDINGKQIQINGKDYILGILHDVTSQVHAENELLSSKAMAEESEKFLRSVANNLINGMIFQMRILDDNKRQFTFLSDSAYRFYGHTPQEIIADSSLLYSRIYQEDLSRILAEEKEALLEMKVFKTEVRLWDMNNTIRWAQVVSSPRIYEGLVYWDGIEIDITDRKLAELKVEESEFVLKSIIDSSTDMIWSVDTENFGLLNWNHSFENYFKLSRNIKLQKGMSSFDLFPPQSSFAILWEDFFKRAISDGSFTFEYQTYLGDRTLNINLGLMRNHEKVFGISVFAKDITEQKINQKNLRKANRLYNVISQINHSIVHQKNADHLLENICQIFVESGKFRMAWVGIVDEQQHTLIPKSFAGYEEGYLNSINQISIQDDVEGRGPSGRSVREKKCVVCSDIEHDSSVRIWKDEAIKRGYRSSIAIPIIVQNKVVASFSLYAEVPNFFDENEIVLLSELASNISFALEAIKKENEHRIAATKLAQSEQLYRLITDNMKDVVWIVDLESLKYRYISPSIVLLRGYSLEEIMEENIMSSLAYGGDEIMSAAFTSRLNDIYAGKLPIETYFTDNVKQLCKDGKLIDVEIVSRFLINDEGKLELHGSTRDITERKIAEEKVISAHDKITEIIENINDGFVAFDKNLNYTFVNKKGAELFGMQPIDLIGKNYYNLFPESKGTPFANAYIEALQTKKSIYFEDYYEPWDRWFENRIYPTAEGIAIYFTETTERKRTEKALLISEERFKSIYNSLQDAYFQVDNLGIITLASPSALKMFGYDSDSEIIGMPANFLYANEAERDSLLNSLKESKSVKDYIGHAKRKDGSIFWASMNIQFRYLNDEIIGTEGVIRDISERRAHEEKIHQLSVAIEQSPVSIVITNFDGVIGYVNPKFCQTTGYSQEEAIGTNPRILQSGILPKSFYSEMWETLLAGKEWKGEFHNKRKNGESFWESAIISPIVNNLGTITHFIAIKEDITEKKQMLDDLIHSKEKAEESDRLKSAFLANLSHEIRTPMNGILGFTSLLKTPDLTESDKLSYIKIIEKSSDRMLNMINDLVDISKIEAGIVEVEMGEININDQIDYVYSMFKNDAEKAGINFSCTKELSHSMAYISTDNQKVTAILLNLLKNALKFTPQGYIEFGYQIIKNQEDAIDNSKNKSVGKIQFYVKDTGVGVSDEKKAIIFDRFRQGSEHLTRNYEGSGLGLSISKAFANLLGGDIWHQSNASTNELGSTFLFSIPFIPISNSKESTTEKPKEKSGLAQSIRPLKILIVEDDSDSEKLLSLIVNRFASELIIAKNGQEAVELCKSNTDIDLILMDIKMPIMNGYEAVKCIREFNENVYIVAQTAFALTGDKEKALAVGCNDYLTKPIHLASFIALLQQHFSPE